jgi:hypothetical protein
LDYHGEIVIEVAQLALKIFVWEVLLGFMQSAVAR